MLKGMSPAAGCADKQEEVEKFAKEKLGTELYGFPFRWEDYKAFKPNIDAAYEKYMAKM